MVANKIYLLVPNCWAEQQHLCHTCSSSVYQYHFAAPIVVGDLNVSPNICVVTKIVGAAMAAPAPTALI